MEELTKEELRKILDEAKTIQTQIRRNATLTENKLLNINSFDDTVNRLKEKIENGETGTDALFQKINSLKQQTEEIKNNSQIKLDEINSQADSVSEKVKEIEEFYTSEFVDLKDKVQDEENGLGKILELASSLKQQTEEIKNNSQIKLDEINSQADSVSEKVKEIEEFYTSEFVDLKDKVQDEENGLQAILDESKRLQKEILNTKKTSQDDYINIKGLKSESTNLKNESEDDKNKIEQYKNESGELKKSIGETLDLVTVSSNKHEFKIRKDEINKSVIFWKRATFVCFLLFGVSLLFIYGLQTLSPNGFNDWKQWYRYLFTTPFIFLVWWCSSNYSLERNLLEKYSFKAVESTSLRSYVKLLSEYFKDNEKERLAITLESIRQIFKEPFKEKDTKRKFIFGIKSIFNVGIEDTSVKKMTAEESKSKEENKKELVK